MERLLTKNKDTDIYLVTFLDVNSVFNYALLSKIHYDLIKNHPIYRCLVLYKDWHKNYNDLVEWASCDGNIDVLNWFKNSGLEFKYSFSAIDLASAHGHTNVLDWFKKSEFKFKYSVNAVDYASENGHIHILNWFKNSGFE